MSVHALRNEPGWLGAFTREQAEGALRNGTRVVKISPEGRDIPSKPGVILGSMSHPDARGGEVCYFVEWAPTPKVAVAVMAFRLRVADW